MRCKSIKRISLCQSSRQSYKNAYVQFCCFRCEAETSVNAGYAVVGIVYADYIAIVETVCFVEESLYVLVIFYLDKLTHIHSSVSIFLRFSC